MNNSLVHFIKLQKDTFTYELPFNTSLCILSIKLDGIEVTDYKLENNSLELDKNLKGDVLEMLAEFPANVPVLKQFGKSLYKLKSKVKRFENNCKYHIEFNCEAKEHEFDFDTQYDPCFCSPKDIRLETGLLLKLTDDMTIYEVIHKNSVIALDAYNQKDNIAMSDEYPNYISLYVKYRTCLDLIYSAYLTIAGNLGSESKLVKNIRIEKNLKLPYLSDLLGEFKDKIRKPEAQLFGVQSAASVFERASKSKTTYPLSKRMSL